MSGKRRKLGTSGMTLIELVVTFTILVVISALVVTSYTNVLEKHRMEADMIGLGQIDVAVKQIMMRDDAFEDVIPYLDASNKLKIAFKVSRDGNTGKACVRLSNALVGDDYNLQSSCDVFYGYLAKYVDEKIDLESVGYQSGEYIVYVQFHSVHVSESRDPIITNSELVVSNSGDTLLRP